MPKKIWGQHTASESTRACPQGTKFGSKFRTLVVVSKLNKPDFGIKIVSK